MSKADDCFNEIVALVEREDANAVERARDTANAYLVGFGLAQAATERASLVARLEAKGPNTSLMKRVIAAVEAGA